VEEERGGGGRRRKEEEEEGFLCVCIYVCVCICVFGLEGGRIIDCVCVFLRVPSLEGKDLGLWAWPISLKLEGEEGVCVCMYECNKKTKGESNQATQKAT
jgi:hypothetical protein